MRRRFLSACAVVALGLGTVVSTSAPANAASWPSNCEIVGWKYDSMAWARCNSGGGQYKVVANCYDWYRGVTVVRIAPTWRNIGQMSVKWCEGTEWLLSTGLMSRAG